MPISYPLSLPSSPGFNSFRLHRLPVVGLNRSPFTGAQEVQVFAGQWWEAEAGLPDLDEDDAAAWRAFFAKLNGSQGTFLMGDPTRATPRGAASSSPGTPLVDGAHAAGSQTLAVKGGPNSSTNWLKEGDYISLGTGTSTRLHMVLDNASTDGTGDVTLTLWPKLRDDYADGASVTVSNCKGVFRLADNRSGDESRPFPFYTMSLSAIEALD